MFSEIMHSLEHWKNQAVPSIRCSVELIDMGSVRFNVRASLSLFSAIPFFKDFTPTLF